MRSVDTRPLTPAQRELVFRLRSERLALVEQQTADARRTLPLYVGTAVVGVLAIVAGVALGGQWRLLSVIGTLFTLLPAWLAWVATDEIQRAPARSKEAVAGVDADLEAGEVEVERFAVHAPWSFHLLPDTPDTELGPRVAFGLPDEERLFPLDEPDAPIPGSIEVFTLPTARWRWTEAQDGPVKPHTSRVLGVDAWSGAVMHLPWEDGEPAFEMATVPE